MIVFPSAFYAPYIDALMILISNISLVLHYTLIDGCNVYYWYSVFFAMVKYKINFLRNHFARCNGTGIYYIVSMPAYIGSLYHCSKYPFFANIRLDQFPNNLKNWALYDYFLSAIRKQYRTTHCPARYH